MEQKTIDPAQDAVPGRVGNDEEKRAAFLRLQNSKPHRHNQGSEIRPRAYCAHGWQWPNYTGALSDDEGMRRQALHDLRLTAREYAELQDGQRTKLFSIACRCARYVAHRVLTEAEFRAALLEAANTNGAIANQGPRWADAAIRKAIIACRRDPLPPLARRFRSGGAHD